MPLSRQTVTKSGSSRNRLPPSSLPISMMLLPLLLLLSWKDGTKVAAQTTSLQAGDMMVVGFASDSPDAFAVVSWVDILANTEIYFTDKGWDCNGFQSSGETILKYTASANLAAGTVLSYVDGEANGSEWEIVSGTFSLSSSGDQLIIFQGTWDNSPDLVFAFDTSGGFENCADVDSSTKSAVPTGLVEGVSAVSFDHSDSFWYRPWYATSGHIDTLKEWMLNRDRFKTTSVTSTRVADYQVPSSFTIHDSAQRGASGYTEYIPGTAPCIILTGHDGDIFPSSITDRNDGCYVNGACVWDKTCAPQDSSNCRAVVLNDENTQDMARRAVEYFADATGGAQRCHLVVNRLGRIKLDPNREEDEAVMGDPTALLVYDEFHGFAETARTTVENSCPNGGIGLVVDFHGHGHPEARIELGYKLTASNLEEDDATLNNEADSSSIYHLSQISSLDFSDIIRGTYSMGAYFEEPTTFNSSGYISVPSPTVLSVPSGESYFQGGYNVEVHGSQTNGGSIDAIQIEFPRYLRANNWDSQEDVLKAFGEYILPEYLNVHYNWTTSSTC